MMMLNLFAAEGPHVSIKAEQITEIAGISITNAYLYGLIISFFIILLTVYAAKKSQVKPMAGIVQIYEYIMEFIIESIEPIFNSKAKALKYAPLFGTFFVFILLTNLSEMLPLVGEGVAYNGSPLFRPFTADLNGTLAMAITSIIIVQILSIKESGIKGHLTHYFTDKPMNPINFFIGLLEVFGEFTRIASLSLRLFINTAVGEILIAVFSFVGGYGLTFTLIPIFLFETLVSAVQAYVFTILSATYLGLATAHSSNEEHATEEVHDSASLVPAEVDA